MVMIFTMCNNYSSDKPRMIRSIIYSKLTGIHFAKRTSFIFFRISIIREILYKSYKYLNEYQVYAFIDTF